LRVERSEVRGAFSAAGRAWGLLQRGHTPRLALDR
jgi:hypothetical protein